MKKKRILAVLFSIIAVLAITGAALYFGIYQPFDVTDAKIEVGVSFTDADLESASQQFESDRNNGYIDYMRKGFEFDSKPADEYCIAKITAVVYNPSKLTTSALYLFPKKDNDVICYLEPYMKAVNILPGESKEVSSYFVCRKNNMTDKEIAEFIGSLDFYLLEEDNIFGKKKIKVSLKSFNGGMI